MFKKKIKETEMRYLPLAIEQHNKYSLDKSVRQELAEIMKKYLSASSVSIFETTNGGIRLFGTTIENTDNINFQTACVARTYKKISTGLDERRIAIEIEEHYYDKKIKATCSPLTLNRMCKGFLVIEDAELKDEPECKMLCSILADAIMQREVLTAIARKETSITNDRGGFINFAEKLLDQPQEVKLEMAFIKACGISEINRKKGYFAGDNILKGIPSQIALVFPNAKVFRISSVTFAFIIKEEEFNENSSDQDKINEIVNTISSSLEVDTIAVYGDILNDPKWMLYRVEDFISHGAPNITRKVIANDDKDDYITSNKTDLKKVTLEQEEEKKEDYSFAIEPQGNNSSYTEPEPEENAYSDEQIISDEPKCPIDDDEPIYYDTSAYHEVEEQGYDAASENTENYTAESNVTEAESNESAKENEPAETAINAGLFKGLQRTEEEESNIDILTKKSTKKRSSK